MLETEALAGLEVNLHMAYSKCATRGAPWKTTTVKISRSRPSWILNRVFTATRAADPTVDEAVVSTTLAGAPRAHTARRSRGFFVLSFAST